jgi:hypothetical protein
MRPCCQGAVVCRRHLASYAAEVIVIAIMDLNEPMAALFLTDEVEPPLGRGTARLDGLLARFGSNFALPDVLMALATCDRRRDFSQPSGAEVHGLGLGGPTTMAASV